MGVELLEIAVKLRKGVMFAIRGCYRSVCNHPFHVGVLCFLIFLYRLSPFVFQLLVSASPILVCTAILLGTLLSFGQPNIPEIETEEKTTLEAVSIKTGVLGETAVVEKTESYYIERFSEKRWDEAEYSTEQPDSSASKLGEVRRGDSDDTAPLIEERSRETGVDDGGILEAKRELGDLRYKEKTEWIEERLHNGEVMENHYASAANKNYELLESDDEKSESDSFDSEKVNVDSLDSPPRSPWTRVEEREDEVEGDEEEEDAASDSGSGRAESSSPDASMADIMPMLDELHPLLDEEAPQTVHISRGGSDAASENFQKSSARGHESDDETENHEELEVADDDNEDGEDEEDAQGDKEEQTKSAITWTEEDQKNLMDLGTSEIERNQRLENLILRRRARKMLAERNLIDLESSDLPFDLAPISTRRQNPFDLPHDYHDISGLPPIPGSAPSVLLPRRNPFDIPYDSSEEKPDLKGDGFQEEFMTSQFRESLFRRHESFHVGPSVFAPKRQDVKMRPYFVPEGSISEESCSSLFQRQSSELSDSKVSSVPETESISSVEDLQDRKLSDEDNLPEVEVIARTKEVTDEGPSGNSELIHEREVDTEEDVHQEPELISKLESVSEHVGHGSQSSEEEDSLDLGQIENRDVEVGELESQLEDVADHYEQRSITQNVEVQGAVYRSNYEVVEQRYTRDSSSSSLSEVSERVFIETEAEGLSMLEGRRDGFAEEQGILTQTSVGSTDLNIASALANDVPHREPVYDTSPRELSKNVSSSSISCDVHPDSDLGFAAVIDKRTVLSIGRESEGSSQEIERDIPSNIEMLPDSSIAHPVDESKVKDVVDIRAHENTNTDSSGVNQRSISEDSSAGAGITSHVSIPLKSSVEASVEEHLMDQHRWEEVPVSSDDKNILTLVQSSEDHNLNESAVEVNEPPFDGQLRAEHSVGVEETVKSANSNADVHHEADEKASSTPFVPFVDDRVAQKLNVAEVQELDHYISSNVNSPSSSEFISNPPIAVETTTAHVDLHTIFEEVDEIKEIDDVLLSELDTVGDFSIKRLGSGSSEFEKHIDSVGEESLSSLHPAESSTVRDVEVHSVEVNKIEDALHPENSREHIDAYEQDVECILELQTSKTNGAENVEVSRMTSNEIDGQNSPYQEAFRHETLSKENEVKPGRSLVKHNYEDTDSGIPELEVQSIEDVDAISRKAELTSEAELTSVETENVVGGAEVSSQGQVDTDTLSGMAELEASKVEDTDLAFKQISREEIEKPCVLERPQAELHNYKDTVSGIPESVVRSIEDVDAVPRKSDFISVENEIMVGDSEVYCTGQVDTDTTTGMPELEASTIEDIDLAFKQITSKEMEAPVALEPPQAELHNQEDTVSGIPESKVLSIEDFDAKRAEFTSEETATMMGGAEVFCQAQVDTDITSEMTELEASKIEDIDRAFKKISSKEIETPVALQPPHPDVHNDEDTVSRIPESQVQPIEDFDAKRPEFTSVETETVVGGAEASCQAQVDTNTASGMTELEASKIEDIDQAFKQISSKEMETAAALEPPQAELHNHQDTSSGIPESGVQFIEDVDAVTEKAEFISVETEIMVGSAEVSGQGQVDTGAISVMPELEASTIEDIDLAFKQISSKEIKKPVVLEPPQAELMVGESATENSEDGALHRDSSVTISTHETSVLEVASVKDDALDDKQLTDGITGSHRVQDSVDRTMHVVESGETQKASSKLHVAESIPSEDTILPPNQVVGDEKMEQLKLNSDNRSVEIQPGKAGHSQEESSVKESSTFAAEKSEGEAKEPEDLHSASSGKGKVSESSSSSSSSSSESSSSDSDKE